MSPRRSSRLAPIEGEAEVREALMQLVEAEGVRGLARRLKFTANAISLVVRGQMQVSTRLARAVGYEKAIVFRKKVD